MKFSNLNEKEENTWHKKLMCEKLLFFKFRPLFLCKLEVFLRSGMNICKAVTLLLIGHR